MGHAQSCKRENMMRVAKQAGIHYGWIVVGVTFLTVLIAAGARSAPAVLIHPLEVEFGWSRDAIALAVAIGLLLFGLGSPFAGRLMDRFGPRRVMLVALLIVGASTATSVLMSALWQLHLFWGLLSGLGAGALSTVLGATVASRWFVAQRGLVLGIFGAAGSAGQLIFFPLLMWLVVAAGWRGATLVLALVIGLVLLPVLLLMRNEPAEIGLQPYGGPPPALAVGESSEGIMRRALRVPEFWLLSGSFFICGASSAGVVGTHLIPYSIDHGIPEVTAASALALMGAMNFAGTLASGWLTDRFDPRKLLAFYYSFRALSLFLLPFVTDFYGLAIFAVIFGLDYIATVPPTVALTADLFGRQNVGSVFGWVFFSHQVGAALLAYLSGVIRVTTGDYQFAFLAAGVLAVMGGLMALRINRAASPAPVPA